MADFKSQLLALTDEQKQEAFEKAKAEANLTEGELVRIVTKEQKTKAKAFMRKFFVPQEPIEKALGVPWNEEVEAFWDSLYDVNISMMLLDPEGEVMSMRTTYFSFENEQHDFDNEVKTESWKHLLKFVEQGEVKSQYYKHFNAKECVHFFGLGTNDKYKNMGLATKLLNTAVLMAKHFGIRPLFIKGEGSNVYSKAVYERSGFELLHEELYSNYVVDGKELIVTGDHNKSLKFYGKAFLD